MKKLMITLSFILALSLIACGKDSQSSEPESAEEALQRINEELNAIIEEDRREAEEKEAQGYPEGVIPDGHYICPDATPIIVDMGSLKFTYWVDSDSRSFVRGRNSDSDRGSYTYDSETEVYQFDVYSLLNGEQIWHYEFDGYMDDSGNLVVTYVKTEDEEYSDLEWVYVRQ